MERILLPSIIPVNEGTLPPVRTSDPKLYAAADQFLKQVVRKRRGAVEESVAMASTAPAGRTVRTTLAELASRQDTEESLPVGGVVLAGAAPERQAPVRQVVQTEAHSNVPKTLADLYRVQESKLGSGQRFAAVEKKAAASGARNPAAVAAAAGIKKYGVQKMEKMAHAHESITESRAPSSGGASKASSMLRKMNQPSRY
jgi:hypothetical protein